MSLLNIEELLANMEASQPQISQPVQRATGSLGVLDRFMPTGEAPPARGTVTSDIPWSIGPAPFSDGKLSIEEAHAQVATQRTRLEERDTRGMGFFSSIKEGFNRGGINSLFQKGIAEAVGRDDREEANALLAAQAEINKLFEDNELSAEGANIVTDKLKNWSVKASYSYPGLLRRIGTQIGIELGLWGLAAGATAAATAFGTPAAGGATAMALSKMIVGRRAIKTAQGVRAVGRIPTTATPWAFRWGANRAAKREFIDRVAQAVATTNPNVTREAITTAIRAAQSRRVATSALATFFNTYDFAQEGAGQVITTLVDKYGMDPIAAGKYAQSTGWVYAWFEQIETMNPVTQFRRAQQGWVAKKILDSVSGKLAQVFGLFATQYGKSVAIQAFVAEPFAQLSLAVGADITRRDADQQKLIDVHGNETPWTMEDLRNEEEAFLEEAILETVSDPEFAYLDAAEAVRILIETARETFGPAVILGLTGAPGTLSGALKGSADFQARQKSGETAAQAQAAMAERTGSTPELDRITRQDQLRKGRQFARQWIANTNSDYESVKKDTATNPENLGKLRSFLQENGIAVDELYAENAKLDDFLMGLPDKNVPQDLETITSIQGIPLDEVGGAVQEIIGRLSDDHRQAFEERLGKNTGLAANRKALVQLLEDWKKLGPNDSLVEQTSARTLERKIGEYDEAINSGRITDPQQIADINEARVDAQKELEAIQARELKERQTQRKKKFTEMSGFAKSKADPLRHPTEYAFYRDQKKAIDAGLKPKATPLESAKADVAAIRLEMRQINDQSFGEGTVDNVQHTRRMAQLTEDLEVANQTVLAETENAAQKTAETLSKPAAKADADAALVEQAAQHVQSGSRPTISAIMKALDVGRNKARAILAQLEERGIIKKKTVRGAAQGWERVAEPTAPEAEAAATEQEAAVDGAEVEVTPQQQEAEAEAEMQSGSVRNAINAILNQQVRNPETKPLETYEAEQAALQAELNELQEAQSLIQENTPEMQESIADIAKVQKQIDANAQAIAVLRESGVLADLFEGPVQSAPPEITPIVPDSNVSFPANRAVATVVRTAVLTKDQKSTLKKGNIVWLMRLGDKKGFTLIAPDEKYYMDPMPRAKVGEDIAKAGRILGQIVEVNEDSVTVLPITENEAERIARSKGKDTAGDVAAQKQVMSMLDKVFDIARKEWKRGSLQVSAARRSNIAEQLKKVSRLLTNARDKEVTPAQRENILAVAKDLLFGEALLSQEILAFAKIRETELATQLDQVRAAEAANLSKDLAFLEAALKELASLRASESKLELQIKSDRESIKGERITPQGIPAEILVLRKSLSDAEAQLKAVREAIATTSDRRVVQIQRRIEAIKEQSADRMDFAESTFNAERADLKAIVAGMDRIEGSLFARAPVTLPLTEWTTDPRAYNATLDSLPESTKTGQGRTLMNREKLELTIGSKSAADPALRPLVLNVAIVGPAGEKAKRTTNYMVPLMKDGVPVEKDGEPVMVFDPERADEPTKFKVTWGADPYRGRVDTPAPEAIGIAKLALEEAKVTQEEVAKRVGLPQKKGESKEAYKARLNSDPEYRAERERLVAERELGLTPEQRRAMRFVQEGRRRRNQLKKRLVKMGLSVDTQGNIIATYNQLMKMSPEMDGATQQQITEFIADEGPLAKRIEQARKTIDTYVERITEGQKTPEKKRRGLFAGIPTTHPDIGLQAVRVSALKRLVGFTTDPKTGKLVHEDARGRLQRLVDAAKNAPIGSPIYMEMIREYQNVRTLVDKALPSRIYAPFSANVQATVATTFSAETKPTPSSIGRELNIPRMPGEKEDAYSARIADDPAVKAEIKARTKKKDYNLRSFVTGALFSWQGKKTHTPLRLDRESNSKLKRIIDVITEGAYWGNNPNDKRATQTRVEAIITRMAEEMAVGVLPEAIDDYLSATPRGAGAPVSPSALLAEMVAATETQDAAATETVIREVNLWAEALLNKHGLSVFPTEVNAKRSRAEMSRLAGESKLFISEDSALKFLTSMVNAFDTIPAIRLTIAKEVAGLVKQRIARDLASYTMQERQLTEQRAKEYAAMTPEAMDYLASSLMAWGENDPEATYSDPSGRHRMVLQFDMDFWGAMQEATLSQLTFEDIGKRAGITRGEGEGIGSYAARLVKNPEAKALIEQYRRYSRDEIGRMLAQMVNVRRETGRVALPSDLGLRRQFVRKEEGKTVRLLPEGVANVRDELRRYMERSTAPGLWSAYQGLASLRGSAGANPAMALFEASHVINTFLDRPEMRAYVEQMRQWSATSAEAQADPLYRFVTTGLLDSPAQASRILFRIAKGSYFEAAGVLPDGYANVANMAISTQPFGLTMIRDAGRWVGQYSEHRKEVAAKRKGKGLGVESLDSMQMAAEIAAGDNPAKQQFFRALAYADHTNRINNRLWAILQKQERNIVSALRMDIVKGVNEHFSAGTPLDAAMGSATPNKLVGVDVSQAGEALLQGRVAEPHTIVTALDENDRRLFALSELDGKEYSAYSSYMNFLRQPRTEGARAALEGLSAALIANFNPNFDYDFQSQYGLVEPQKHKSKRKWIIGSAEIKQIAANLNVSEAQVWQLAAEWEKAITSQKSEQKMAAVRQAVAAVAKAESMYYDLLNYRSQGEWQDGAPAAQTAQEYAEATYRSLSHRLTALARAPITGTVEGRPANEGNIDRARIALQAADTVSEVQGWHNLRTLATPLYRAVSAHVKAQTKEETASLTAARTALAKAEKGDVAEARKKAAKAETTLRAATERAREDFLASDPLLKVAEENKMAVEQLTKELQSLATSTKDSPTRLLMLIAQLEQRAQEIAAIEDAQKKGIALTQDQRVTALRNMTSEQRILRNAWRKIKADLEAAVVDDQTVSQKRVDALIRMGILQEQGIDAYLEAHPKATMDQIQKKVRLDLYDSMLLTATPNWEQIAEANALNNFREAQGMSIDVSGKIVVPTVQWHNSIVEDQAANPLSFESFKQAAEAALPGSKVSKVGDSVAWMIRGKALKVEFTTDAINEWTNPDGSKVYRAALMDHFNTANGVEIRVGNRVVLQADALLALSSRFATDDVVREKAFQALYELVLTKEEKAIIDAEYGIKGSDEARREGISRAARDYAKTRPAQTWVGALFEKIRHIARLLLRVGRGMSARDLMWEMQNIRNYMATIQPIPPENAFKYTLEELKAMPYHEIRAVFKEQNPGILNVPKTQSELYNMVAGSELRMGLRHGVGQSALNAQSRTAPEMWNFDAKHRGELSRAGEMIGQARAIGDRLFIQNIGSLFSRLAAAENYQEDSPGMRRFRDIRRGRTTERETVTRLNEIGRNALEASDDALFYNRRRMAKMFRGETRMGVEFAGKKMNLPASVIISAALASQDAEHMQRVTQENSSVSLESRMAFLTKRYEELGGTKDERAAFFAEARRIYDSDPDMQAIGKFFRAVEQESATILENSLAEIIEWFVEMGANVKGRDQNGKIVEIEMTGDLAKLFAEAAGQDQLSDAIKTTESFQTKDGEPVKVTKVEISTLKAFKKVKNWFPIDWINQHGGASSDDAIHLLATRMLMPRRGAPPAGQYQLESVRDVAMKTIAQTGKIAGLALPLLKMRAYVSSPVVQAAWRQQFGANFVSEVETLIQNVEGVRPDQSHLSKAARLAANMLSRAALISPGTMLKQAASAPLYAAVTTHPELYAKAVVKSFMPNAESRERFAKDPFVLHRYQTGKMDPTVRESVAGGMANELFLGERSIGNRLFGLLRPFDRAALWTGWNQAMLEVEADTPHLKGEAYWSRVSQRFDEMTSASQPQSDPEMMASIIANRGGLNTLLMFYTQRTQMANLMLRSLDKMRNHGTPEATKQFAITAVNVVFVNAMLMSLIGAMRRDSRDWVKRMWTGEEKEEPEEQTTFEWLAKWTAQIASENLSLVPLVAEAKDAVMGSPFAGRATLTGEIRRDTARAVRRVQRIVELKEESDAAPRWKRRKLDAEIGKAYLDLSRDMSLIWGFLSGIPVKQLDMLVTGGADWDSIVERAGDWF